jgi:1,4-alpha-glucan branching enzyme
VNLNPPTYSSSDKFIGMGAIPYSHNEKKGTAFKVWAPHADQVYVTGDFAGCGWDPTSYPMEKEENGYWYADIQDAYIGHKYKYVIHNGSKRLWRRDPYGTRVSQTHKNSEINPVKFNWNCHDFEMPDWNDIVIYEMHVGTFNDQNRANGMPGNLNMAIKKLPYLKKLGINVIELMPSMEFPGSFSWGYNPSDIFAIEADYGGPEKFVEFIDEAHKLGIAVMLDVVYNHFGPYELDLWQFDGWSLWDQGGIYFYNDWRNKTPWGNTRPDYTRPEVRQYIFDNAMCWLHRFRLDGLRFDGTAFIRKIEGMKEDGTDIPEGWTLMQWINDAKNSQQPWKMSIAEDLKDNSWITKPTSEGGAGFDAQWCAMFVHTIRSIIIDYNDANRDMDKVKNCIDSRYNADAFDRVIYTEAHDAVANGQARIVYEIDQSSNSDISYYAKKRSTLGAGILFTSPGIPMIFQGQELLEDEWFRDKTPIHWQQEYKYAGIVCLYSDLINLRRNTKQTTRGLKGQNVNVHHVNNLNKVIAYHRWEQGGPHDDVIIVANFANTSYENYTIGFPREGMWKVRFNSDWQGYDRDFTNVFAYDTEAKHGERDGMKYQANVGLGPYTLLILSQDD